MAIKHTETQRRYRDAHTLRKAGIPASPSDLAAATGRDEADFHGLLVAKDSPELAALSKANMRRPIRMAGMDENPNGVIGFGLIVQDLKGLIDWIRNRKNKRRS